MRRCAVCGVRKGRGGGGGDVCRGMSGKVFRVGRRMCIKDASSGKSLTSSGGPDQLPRCI